MTAQTHKQMANFIWSICNLLRGPYKRNEYRKVILPLTVLRRFDCILLPTKQKVLDEFAKLKGKSENVIQARIREITHVPFYNLSKLTFEKLLDDPNQIAPNLNSYINAFSPNLREIFEKFEFGDEVRKMNEKNLLYEVVKRFASPEIDLSFKDMGADQANVYMGYVFEELIRIGAEQANEEAGEHFTPREVIKLMVNLLLSPEQDLRKSHVVKTIYDPACGTGGMLSVAENYIRQLNAEADPHLFGQDWNDEAWAVCRSDMLIKGEEADNIKPGDTFTKDGYPKDKFDYMLANPPFGVEWKQQAKTILDENQKLGYDGRFGAGLPRINDGSFLFLQHMISKMRQPKDGGSRIAIVFNGAPLFSGDAGSGESEIRRWIIENDWLESIVALPDQLFYNTGISTYIWVLTNHKEKHRKGKIQLIDARQFYIKMKKSLGNKRNQIGDGEEGRVNQISDISKIYGDFKNDDTRDIEIEGSIKKITVSKVFDNQVFGYNKITVERPLRLNFAANDERIARIEEQKGFNALATSEKKNETVRQKEIADGRKRQNEIRKLLSELKNNTNGNVFTNRLDFLKELKELDRKMGVRLSAIELKAILEALSEKDETAAECKDGKGNIEPDNDLRSTENVSLNENIDKFFKQEVKPHVFDAWIAHEKTVIGYEIPLNRHFYKYQPPRAFNIIESDIKKLELDIVKLLAEVTDRTTKISGALLKGVNPFSKMIDSKIEWLGDIPEHWQVKKLKYIAETITGFAFSSDDYIADETMDAGVPVIRIGDILENGTVDITNAKRLPSEYLDQYRPVRIDNGDILMAMTGATIGKAGKYSNTEPGLLNQRVCKFVSKKINREFMWYILKSPQYLEHIRLTGFGGAQPNISDVQLLDFYCAVPPPHEQIEIITFLNQETDKIDILSSKIEIAIHRLKEYRGELISSAGTGKINMRGTL
jgi:type I restriction enzyme M protein